MILLIQGKNPNYKNKNYLVDKENNFILKNITASLTLKENDSFKKKKSLLFNPAKTDQDYSLIKNKVVLKNAQQKEVEFSQYLAVELIVNKDKYTFGELVNFIHDKNSEVIKGSIIEQPFLIKTSSPYLKTYLLPFSGYEDRKRTTFNPFSYESKGLTDLYKTSDFENSNSELSISNEIKIPLLLNKSINLIGTPPYDSNKVYCEIIKGERVKYESKLVEFEGLIFRILVVNRRIEKNKKFPASYGFVSNTLSEDGEELDIFLFSNNKETIKNIKRLKAYTLKRNTKECFFNIPGKEKIRMNLIGGLITGDDKGIDPKLIFTSEKEEIDFNYCHKKIISFYTSTKSNNFKVTKKLSLTDSLNLFK